MQTSKYSYFLNRTENIMGSSREYNNTRHRKNSKAYEKQIIGDYFLDEEYEEKRYGKYTQNMTYINEIEKSKIKPMTKQKSLNLLYIELGHYDNFMKSISYSKSEIDVEYFCESVYYNRLDILKWLFENSDEETVKMASVIKKDNVFNLFDVFFESDHLDENMFSFLNYKLGPVTHDRMITKALNTNNRRLLDFTIQYHIVNGERKIRHSILDRKEYSVYIRIGLRNFYSFFKKEFFKQTTYNKTRVDTIKWFADFFIIMEDLDTKHDPIEVQFIISNKRSDVMNSSKENIEHRLEYQSFILREYISEHVKMRDITKERKEYLENILNNMTYDNIGSLTVERSRRNKDRKTTKEITIS